MYGGTLGKEESLEVPNESIDFFFKHMRVVVSSSKCICKHQSLQRRPQGIKDTLLIWPKLIAFAFFLYLRDVL